MRKEETLYFRPVIKHLGGKTEMVKLFGCDCGDKARGPKGGVCGACGRAIPDERGR